MNRGGRPGARSRVKQIVRCTRGCWDPANRCVAFMPCRRTSVKDVAESKEFSKTSRTASCVNIHSPPPKRKNSSNGRDRHWSTKCPRWVCGKRKRAAEDRIARLRPHTGEALQEPIPRPHNRNRRLRATLNPACSRILAVAAAQFHCGKPLPRAVPRHARNVEGPFPSDIGAGDALG